MMKTCMHMHTAWMTAASVNVYPCRGCLGVVVFGTKDGRAAGHAIAGHAMPCKHQAGTRRWCEKGFAAVVPSSASRPASTPTRVRRPRSLCRCLARRANMSRKPLGLPRTHTRSHTSSWQCLRHCLPSSATCARQARQAREVPPHAACKPAGRGEGPPSAPCSGQCGARTGCCRARKLSRA